jgi:type IV pilus assembly protein PilA
MSQWYYVDANEQRQGPVAVAALAQAYAAGWLDRDSLVWRDGMAQWQPLSACAGELGIDLSAARPPRAPSAGTGYSPTPAAPAARPGFNWKLGCLIAGVVGIIPGLLVIGILAAIAVPAYSDYTTRARVAEGLNEAAMAKLTVAEAYVSQGAWPADNAAAGYAFQPSATLADVQIRENTITLTYQAPAAIAGQTIVLTASASDDYTVYWECNQGTMEMRFRPANCRY